MRPLGEIPTPTQAIFGRNFRSFSFRRSAAELGKRAARFVVHGKEERFLRVERVSEDLGFRNLGSNEPST